MYSGDRAEQLARAFSSSVTDQTVRPDEVVIVQDGPVPRPLEAELESIIRTSPVPVRHVVLPQNRGLATALTVGLEACRHEIVARMDADDISLPERFARQIAVMDEGYDLVGTAMFEFQDDNGTMLTRRTPPAGHEEIARYARFHDPFNHPTVAYRKEAVARAGGYVDVGLMEDYWLFARMIHSGARTRNLQEPLVLYRVGAGAYKRRGGYRQLRAELQLQRELRRLGFTTPVQAARNVLVRGTYRLVPESVRRVIYRRYVAPAGLGRDARKRGRSF